MLTGLFSACFDVSFTELLRGDLSTGFRLKEERSI